MIEVASGDLERERERWEREGGDGREGRGNE